MLLFSFHCTAKNLSTNFEPQEGRALKQMGVFCLGLDNFSRQFGQNDPVFVGVACVTHCNAYLYFHITFLILFLIYKTVKRSDRGLYKNRKSQ